MLSGHAEFIKSTTKPWLESAYPVPVGGPGGCRSHPFQAGSSAKLQGASDSRYRWGAREGSPEVFYPFCLPDVSGTSLSAISTVSILSPGNHPPELLQQSFGSCL